MSKQLDAYLASRGNGLDMTDAASLAGIPLAEAELHERDIASGELKLPVAASDQVAKCKPLPTTHNQEDPMSESIAADELRLLIERVERLEEEKKAIGQDVSGVYKEAKSRGYCTSTMRRIVRLRAMEDHKRQEAAALLETYAGAVNLQGLLF